MQLESIKRINDTKSIVGLSRSTIYAMIKRGEFPQPVLLGSRSVGWRNTDIQEWIKSRQERRA